MKSVKRALLLLTASLLLLPGTARAEKASDITQAKDWDADDASLTYCSSLGKRGTTAGGTSRGGDYETPRTAQYKVTTSGESATITSFTASSGSLSFVEVGDIISFVLDGQRVERAIIDKADDDTITVSEVIDLSAASTGNFYSWRNVDCGTAGTDGEIVVRNLNRFMLTVQVNQMSVDAGSVNISIECRQKYGPFLVLEEKAVTTGGTGIDAFLTRFFQEERWEACRAGVSVDDDDATDTGADAEEINIWISGDGMEID